MLRLNKLTDYAIVLLARMSQKGDGVVTAAELSDSTGLPLPTVSKILKCLGKSVLVEAHRGAAGGYKIGRAPSLITMVDIIEAMDGPIAITDCVEISEHEPCQFVSQCSVHGNWDKVNNAIRDALKAVTLADMIASNAHVDLTKSASACDRDHACQNNACTASETA
jgi:FeS assembly SUF system regulator